MTREEAIEILKDLWRTKHSTYLEADIRKALEMAIKALSQECVEPTHKHVENALDMRCEDAISRPTGHWITEIKSDLRSDMWPTNPRCSECGGEPYYSNTIYNYKFCPFCGAKMVESEENNG